MPDWFSLMEQNVAPTELSSYFLNLSRLLDRVESATTHYQVLDLERAASRERIDEAYRHVLGVVYPEYGISAVLPADVVARADSAFRKISLAFSVLASFAGRRGYDPRIAGRPETVPDAAVPSGSQTVAGPAGPAPKPRIPDRAEATEIKISHRVSHATVYRESGTAASEDNRRRCERIRLSIPARATGCDRKNGKWNEMAQTVDVDRTGVTLRMRRRVRCGSVLYLTLPLPTKLRSHGYAAPHYNVYALVRRVEPPRDGVWVASLEFLGEHPPSGFLDKPWAVFRTGKWDGSERRRSPRMKRSERIRIEYYGEPMRLLASEEAETENVSRTGLRILVKSAPGEFDIVRVRCAVRGFDSMAAPRSRFVAKDGVERLCVQFIDKEWPL
ncbi:MAG: J domain-containing protein [Acidobacteriota bacterium]